MNIVKRKVETPAKRSVRKYRPVWNPVENLFNDMFNYRSPLDLAPFNFGQTFWPSLNMKDDGDQYLIEVDVPGYDEANLEISIDGRQMTISGNHEDLKEEEDKNKYLVYERSSKNFVRTVGLPEGANIDNISAELHKGILSVVVPKTDDANTPKKVSIVNKE